jgi:hypothetical protein
MCVFMYIECSYLWKTCDCVSVYVCGKHVCLCVRARACLYFVCVGYYLCEVRDVRFCSRGKYVYASVDRV